MFSLNNNDLEVAHDKIKSAAWNEGLRQAKSKIGFELRSLVMQKTWFSMEHSVRIHTTNVALQKEINESP